MLPIALLSTTRGDAARSFVVPRYLTGRDEPWLRAAIDLFDGYVGRTVAEREADLRVKVREIARRHGASPRAADGVAHVLRRVFKAAVKSPLDPTEARRITFEEAGRDEVFDRDLALSRAAERLSSTPEDVERALFADRPPARRVEAPAVLPSAAELVEAYNLALVQGLLLASEEVTVEVREHVRAVVRFAKLAGLLCTCAFAAQGTRLSVSGPLSILRHTTKYGFALASFFPAVVTTVGFELTARCVLAGDPVVVRVLASDRIGRTHTLPRDADSAVERALSRELRRLGGPWTLVREAHALRAGDKVIFPDFTLQREDGQSVLVEIVGFYTPEYLRSKMEALRAAGQDRMIVCVDESLACADGDVPGRVMRFKRRVDARALVAMAEEMTPPFTAPIAQPLPSSSPVTSERTETSTASKGSARTRSSPRAIATRRKPSVVQR